MRNFEIVEIKSEVGAGTRGASLGIDALKLAAADRDSSVFTNLKIKEAPTANYPALYNKTLFKNAKFLDVINPVLEGAAKVVQEVAANAFPIVLGSDHSVGAATLCGVKNANPNKRIGVIWIDAHADLHTPYTTPSGNVHGMPLAMCLGINNEENGSNNLSEKEEMLWEASKSIGGNQPKINPEDIVFISLRDTEDPERALVDKHQMGVFTVEDVRSTSPEQIVERCLDRLIDCDMICVSFDVDSMDPEVSVGTGTPVPNGLSSEEAKSINVGLVKNEKVVSWEMVEINPLLDTKNAMAEVSLDILEAVIQEIS